MSPKEFIQVKVALVEAFEKALLKAEEKQSGFLQAWHKELSEGPK